LALQQPPSLLEALDRLDEDDDDDDHNNNNNNGAPQTADTSAAQSAVLYILFSLSLSRCVDNVCNTTQPMVVTTHSFEVQRDMINKVRHRCELLDCPTLEEYLLLFIRFSNTNFNTHYYFADDRYDFRHDHATDSLAADLKPSTSLRPYQVF
jgi:hypothetical protein